MLIYLRVFTYFFDNLNFAGICSLLSLAWPKLVIEIFVLLYHGSYNFISSSYLWCLEIFSWPSSDRIDDKLPLLCGGLGLPCCWLGLFLRFYDLPFLFSFGFNSVFSILRGKPLWSNYWIKNWSKSLLSILSLLLIIFLKFLFEAWRLMRFNWSSLLLVSKLRSESSYSTNSLILSTMKACLLFKRASIAVVYKR